MTIRLISTENYQILLDASTSDKRIDVQDAARYIRDKQDCKVIIGTEIKLNAATEQLRRHIHYFITGKYFIVSDVEIEYSDRTKLMAAATTLPVFFTPVTDDDVKDGLDMVNDFIAINDVKRNYVIDMFILAFNIKLTAIVIERYCALISSDINGGEFFASVNNADLLGTEAMHMGFYAYDLFSLIYGSYEFSFPDWWFNCLDFCTNDFESEIKELQYDEMMNSRITDIKSNSFIDMLLVAFDIKLTATIIEKYCEKISSESGGGDYFAPPNSADLLGTQAMYLGFDANDLFSIAYSGDYDSLTFWWFDCLDFCTKGLKEEIKSHHFFEMIDSMYIETEDEFNTRVMLEEMYRFPMDAWYWDTEKNTIHDVAVACS